MFSKAALLLVTLVVVAACTGSEATPSSVRATVAVTPEVTQAPPTVAATPVATAPPAATAAPPDATAQAPGSFTSLLYGYGITLPADWIAAAAMLRWDGASSPGHDDGSVDKFVASAALSVFAFAGPVTGNIDTFVKDNIAWTVRDHGDTCPATKPEKTESIKIGGEAGVLLSWDCGILIDEALIVREGTGYVFVMRDLNVHAATDPADRKLLEEVLSSVTFP